MWGCHRDMPGRRLLSFWERAEVRKGTGTYDPHLPPETKFSPAADPWPAPRLRGLCLVPLAGGKGESYDLG